VVIWQTMGLKTYRRKRDFSRTREPRGSFPPERTGRLYLIQKHAARRLHYDFRLELNGVLLSWAVPKGPSLDPKDKRLAVHVEDHPVEYGDFEGTIPQREYGGGTVLLWDRGRWIEEGDPVAGLRAGKLKFRLEGEKLQGGWTLVRMGRSAAEEGKENWLLIKENDEKADPSGKRDILKERPESVASGRSLEEIRAARDREWRSNRASSKKGTDKKQAGRSEPGRKVEFRLDPGRLPGARKSNLPERLRPQLATLVDQVPKGEEWIHEIKYDGYRALCRIEKGKAQFFTREWKDWTARFRDLAVAAVSLPADQALIDGEVVVLQPDGTTSFQALQNVLKRGEDQRLAYYAFDLPHLDGYDLTRVALHARKDALFKLLQPSAEGSPIRYSDHVVGEGQTLLKHACQFALEGIISKKFDRPYSSGRGRDWLKIKCLQSQEFVIGGFTEPSGSRKGLGALLLGVYDEEGILRYAGRVGTGFTAESLKNLRARLSATEQKKPLFSNPPKGADAKGAHWVKPTLVAEVDFTEWTSDGVLRHPSFKGLREDKPAVEVKREFVRSGGKVTANPAPADSDEVAGVRLTHPDRILYPDQEITKRQLALYYQEVADRILSYMAGRPLALVRCPDGHDKECFYQKHAHEALDESVERIRLREGKGMATYIAINSVRGLISLVQMGTLEFHPWGSRTDRLEQPDRLVFDLDPDPTVSWKQVSQAAQALRTRLNDLGLAAFAKTTGGKGLHVVVPLVRRQGWDEIKEFCREFAETFVRESPELYTASMSKAKRRGKIFIDYLRNARGATAVAAYSTRAKAGAPVSTPIDWDELAVARSDRYTVGNLGRRLAELRRDPWEQYDDARRPITVAMRKKLAR
jgi:bifunctional non-homologous end joining protein LigD